MSWCAFDCLTSYIFVMPDESFLHLLYLLATFEMLLIIVHEGGHYLVSKFCGVGAEEFSLGKGWVIYSKKVTGTACMLVFRVLPIGGSVTYSNDYFNASNLEKAFISSGGWMATVIVATLVVIELLPLGANNPLTSILCMQILLHLIVGLSPITSDGRKTLFYLYLSGKEFRGNRDLSE